MGADAAAGFIRITGEQGCHTPTALQNLTGAQLASYLQIRNLGSAAERSAGVRAVRLFHREPGAVLGRRLRPPHPCDKEKPLPAQMHKVLRGLLQGRSEKQIARDLGISPFTVNRHVQRLYRRFGVHSRGELVFRCRNMLYSLFGSSE